MRNMILVILMFLVVAVPALAAPDPVTESAATVEFWNREDLFASHFSKSAGATILVGAGMTSYSDFYSEQLPKEHGELKIEFLGRGQAKTYSWKTAVWNTAVLQRKMLNNDYKKMFILAADYLADNDRMQYGNEAMPAEYFLMFIVNRLGRNMQKGGNPLIVYLANAMENPIMKKMNPNTGFGKFWIAIVTGDNDAALAVLRSVPDTRLTMPVVWNYYWRTRQLEQR